MFIKLQNCTYLTQLIICKIIFLKMYKNKINARTLCKKVYNYFLLSIFTISFIQILRHVTAEERERECQINGLPKSLIEPG